MTTIYELNCGDGEDADYPPCYIVDRDEAIQACDDQCVDDYAYVMELEIAEFASIDKMACALLNRTAWADKSSIIHESPVGCIKYFWAYAYRHYLRDTHPMNRVAVRTALLAAGLPLDGESDKHEQIIVSITQKETQ